MKLKANDENIYVPKSIKKEHFEKLIDYRDNEVRKNPQLRNLFIEMTMNCNQHCRHCGSNCGEKFLDDQLSNEEIKNFLFELKKDLKKENKNLPFLSITGGEPLLRKDLVDIMSYAHSLGYSWGMTSNGLLIDEKLAIELKKAGMYSIGLSLDGLEETHDWFRQSKGSYQKVLNATKILVDTGFDNVMLTTVVHKRNINELEELYKVVKEINCNTWRIINVDPIGRAKDNEEIVLYTMDYKRIIDFIYENRAKDNKLDICYGCNHFLGYKYEREVRPWYFLCTAGIYTAGIFYNGDIGACLDIQRSIKTIQGNIREHNFYEIWLNRFDVYRKDRTKDSKTCKDCKHKDKCAGDGFHTWNLEEWKPNLCMYNELKKAKKIGKEENKKAKKDKKKI